MSPENANIFVAEDDPQWQAIIKKNVGKGGHTVTHTAQTKTDALAQIPNLESSGVQVAIVDGNLTRGNSSGDDGREIVAAIRSQAPSVKIIGFSASNTIAGVDTSLDKTTFEPIDLPNTVTKL